MRQINKNIERIAPLIKNIFIPAALFGITLVCFYIWNNASLPTLKTLHYLFYIAGFAGFMILLFFNQRQPVFHILLMTLSYIIINRLKQTFGADYQTTAYYTNLCFFLPANILAFYGLANARLLTRTNVFLLLAVFAQFSIGEFLGQNNLQINLNIYGGYWGGISIVGLIAFIIVLSFFFIRTAQSGAISDYAVFFYTLSLLWGMIYSENPTALTFFYSIAALILLTGIIRNLYYNTHKDPLTGLRSRYSYMRDSAAFPLKYSIGVICIDDYAHMQNVFGRRDRDKLTRMITSKIIEEEGEENLYRYTEDEFILVLKNENKTESAKHLEKIRRAIASAEFILNNRKKSIKLTVSTCVSEKKRSDATSMEVLYRIRKTLQKANEFSHNISSKA